MLLDRIGIGVYALERPYDQMYDTSHYKENRPDSEQARIIMKGLLALNITKRPIHIGPSTPASWAIVPSTHNSLRCEKPNSLHEIMAELMAQSLPGTHEAVFLANGNKGREFNKHSSHLTDTTMQTFRM